jgi:hypothetical protein
LTQQEHRQVEREASLSSKRKVKESGYTPKKMGNADWGGITEEQESSYDPRYGPTNRRFHLFYLLILSPCTREDIFVWMKDYYKLNVAESLPDDLALQRARRMFQRDLQYLEKMGYTVERYQDAAGNTFYQIAKALANLQT